MPKKILASQRAHFWRLYQQNHTILEASRRAGFSQSYGKKLVREGIGAPAGASSNEGRAKVAKADQAELAGRPKRLHELTPVARDCLEDFGRFRARYLGSMSLPWQEEAAQMTITHLASEDDSYGVVNAPQGSGKTRLFTHDIPTWLTARDRSIRGCLGSGTKPISARMTGNLRNTFARKSPVVAADRWKSRGMARDADATLAQDYGRFKPIMAGVQWTREEFTVEGYWEDVPPEQAELAEYLGEGQDKEATWAAFSYEAQVMSLRFDFMNWDDLHTHRQLRNPDLMQDLFNWWDVEAESRLDPGGLCLLTMQRLGSNDVSRYLLDKIDPAFEIDADRPGDAPRQYFHVVFKAHYDDRCQEQHGKDAPAYPEGCMLDPRRITEQKINAKKIAGSYEVVYQQEDTDPSNVLVHKAWVNGGLEKDVEYEGCWDTNRARGELPLIPPGARTVRYMTVDPSPTKWWACLDMLYVLLPDTERLAGFRYVIDMHRARMQAPDFLDFSRQQDSYVGLAEDWSKRAKEQGIPISHLIMERNAAQRWAMQYESFRTWSRTRGVIVVQHETTQNKSDPTFGVWATLPSAFQHGRYRLPGDMGTQSRFAFDPLVHEVTTYPGSATDDIVMSLWFGEYHLDHLIGNTMGSLNFYTDQPEWIADQSLDPVTARVAELARR